MALGGGKPHIDSDAELTAGVAAGELMQSEATAAHFELEPVDSSGLKSDRTADKSLI